ncbi:hypothetical protein AVEN_167186-1 [Araneus ventricosus]|uniref:Uncharacterized protein n=1 Tax=Araneus ventricosus TaxID=182803 RepID=A0A4Y2TXX7_ARAVE|nr:hypothetical protein AVEN_167186-1 [Araneus ventricosus]
MFNLVTYYRPILKQLEGSFSDGQPRNVEPLGHMTGTISGAAPLSSFSTTHQRETFGHYVLDVAYRPHTRRNRVFQNPGVVSQRCWDLTDPPGLNYA